LALIWWLLLAAFLVFVVITLWFSGIRKRRPGQIDMVLLTTAAGTAEAQLSAGSLRSVGIHARLVAVTDSSRFTSPYACEIWVRAGDEAVARDILGLDR